MATTGRSQALNSKEPKYSMAADLSMIGRHGVILKEDAFSTRRGPTRISWHLSKDGEALSF